MTLQDFFKENKKIALAFSGGVDNSLCADGNSLVSGCDNKIKGNQNTGIYFIRCAVVL